jgi:uncharacterized membrane protein
MPTTLQRALRHVFYDDWAVRRRFPRHTLEAIDREITVNERRHSGEIVFAVESSLRLRELRETEGPRDRAIDVFSLLRVWDTEHNNGVLIYVLLADRRVEIVADRGIHRQVGAQAWETICGLMQQEFRAGRFHEGAIIGVHAVSDLLAAHYPWTEGDVNELANEPVIIRR